MSEFTLMFAAARAGDQAAVGRIFEWLYPELKSVARARLSRSRRLTIMDTTMLVHESFLRMQKLGDLQVQDRHHFLAYAARVIRTVIVDIVRHERADKRGGDEPPRTLDTEAADNALDDQSDVIAVAEALESLEAMDPRLAAVVEMRYFAGYSEEETAKALEVSVRTVSRDWEKARAFLMVALRR